MAFLRSERVHADDNDHDVRKVGGGFDERQNVGIFPFAKPNVGERPQRGVFPSGAIQANHVVLYISGAVPVPIAHIEFFRVLVLLGSGKRVVFAKLIAAVNAVDRRERGGESQTQAERGPPAFLEHVAQHVRRVGEKIGTQKIPHRRRGELGDVRLQSRARCCAR